MPEVKVKSTLRKLDHPIIFALTITLVVVGTISVLSWLFNSLGWNGPLQVLKGGVVPTSPATGATNA